jgi:hypothetical protein
MLGYAAEAMPLTEPKLDVNERGALLTLPPPPRWGAIACVVILSAVVLGNLWLCYALIRPLIYSPGAPPKPELCAAAFMTACLVINASVLAYAALWLRKLPLMTRRIDVRDGLLTVVVPGVWRDRRGVSPTERVRDFRVERIGGKTLNGKYQFVLRGAQIPKWAFFSPRAEFGEDVATAIRNALAHPPAVD